MRNIFLLPTDKPSRLYEFGGEYHLQIKSQENFRSQHIYITSDEEIKDRNCWVTNGVEIFKPSDLPEYSLEYANRYWEKIILTTDQELIADGVQAIDDEFLEWFIKNPSCEKVEVRKIGEEWIYNADVPKKETEFEDSIENSLSIMSIANDMFGKKEEPKQETLEKVAKKQWGNVHRTESIDFIAGANLQAERILTDGDLVKLLDFVSKEYNISNGVGWFHSHESIEDVSSKEVLDKWFDKYKKK
jgi:hypothetical protein